MSDNHRAAALGHLATIERTMAVIAAACSRLAGAETLESGTFRIGEDGTLTRTWRVPFAGVAIENRSAADVVIEPSTNRGEAPTPAQAIGPGIFSIGPDRAGTYNISGYTLTIYGTPGDTVSLQVFARPQPPAWR